MHKSSQEPIRAWKKLQVNRKFGYVTLCKIYYTGSMLTFLINRTFLGFYISVKIYFSEIERSFEKY